MWPDLGYLWWAQINTVVALEDCLLLTVDQTEFRSFINILPELRKAIETNMKVRQAGRQAHTRPLLPPQG